MNLAAASLFPDLLSHVQGALRGLNSRDLLTTTADVVIVYYVVYRILKLVRGTRAAQTLAGMFILGGLFFLAKRLDLFAVSWLFEKLIDYFIIFFVVIFQQDLRRALMQVGQNLFTRHKYEETYVIEEVVQAAGELAKKNIGGLIVIERDADLSEHLGEVGVELDARVTKELLVTLFVPDPQNHLHDGAVIIRNLRVQQAGAVLPLSGNVKLDKQFGTRHRAAIGITEESDAVVVVISEERGEVSLCFNGNIAHSLDAATLRKALLGLFQKKKAKGKGQAQGSKPASAGAATGKAVPVSAGALGAADESGSKKVPAELLALFSTQPLGGRARTDGTSSTGAGQTTPSQAPAAMLESSSKAAASGSDPSTMQTSAKAMLERAEKAASMQAASQVTPRISPSGPGESRSEPSVAASPTGQMAEQTTAKFRIPLLDVLPTTSGEGGPAVQAALDPHVASLAPASAAQVAQPGSAPPPGLPPSPAVDAPREPSTPTP
ncbi:MAG: TIGR00159 family protein [Myxococcales bacterium]|nr:TIGR00159 family protein [Myxococcales bacterium]